MPTTPATKLLWIVIPILLTIIGTLTGAWGMERNRIDFNHEARLDCLEARLERIETKLDIIINRVQPPAKQPK